MERDLILLLKYQLQSDPIVVDNLVPTSLHMTCTGPGPPTNFYLNRGHYIQPETEVKGILLFKEDWAKGEVYIAKQQNFNVKLKVASIIIDWISPSDHGSYVVWGRF